MCSLNHEIGLPRVCACRLQERGREGVCGVRGRGRGGGGGGGRGREAEGRGMASAHALGRVDLQVAGGPRLAESGL